MIHTNMPRKWAVFLLPRRQTRSAIYGSQMFDSHKWPTVLVRKVKGKPRNFEANWCRSLYSTFTQQSQIKILLTWMYLTLLMKSSFFAVFAKTQTLTVLLIQPRLKPGSIILPGCEPRMLCTQRNLTSQLCFPVKCFTFRRNLELHPGSMNSF